MPMWKEFFDSHAPRYEENVFTRWTQAEAGFLTELLDLRPGARLLDLGCGTGRHAIELARRGMRVLGIDLSEGMLAQARSRAQGAGVLADPAEVLALSTDPAGESGRCAFLEADATSFRAGTTFDHVLCLCEGGFGLIESGEEPVAHDLAILRTAFEHLVPSGRFVLTALNGYLTIRQMTDEMVRAGAFDPATMMSQYDDVWKLPEGDHPIRVRERLFIPPEVVAMMRHAGFEVEHVWGGTAGEWGRRPLKLDEIEAMYVARRPA